MVKRNKIALIYEYNEAWIGGTYYIQNLINATNTLVYEEMPFFVIITKSEKDYNNLVAITSYPFIERRYNVKELNLIQRGVNFFTRKISGKNFLRTTRKNVYSDIDLLFPAVNENKYIECKNKLYWIPDFQEHYLPHFFTDNELTYRKKYQEEIVEKGKHILFSSESAKNDFNTIYPTNKLNQYVLPFSVTHPAIDYNINVLNKYNINRPYFICSNQFWKHKNHQVIVQALKLLKATDKNVLVVLTGKEEDYRNPTYFVELKKIVEEYDVTKNILFLGFVNRNDQLRLIKNSMAVIQPSLFEGWSTSIEDAKALNKKIIASAISVHKEQLITYSNYTLFAPNDAQGLARILADFKIDDTCYFNYNETIHRYGFGFNEIVKKIISNSEL